MIEVPRAALTADAIAETAEFFSFGTNDLTQMTFGYSRDDVNSFLPDYLEKEILERDPFQSLDTGGVGQLVDMAVKTGRSTNPKLKCGICGEHGGDPRSVEFCHEVGLNYVSCSPFRVPIARLAAAHAAIKQSQSNGSAKGAKNHPLWLKRKLPRDVRIEFDTWSTDRRGDIDDMSWLQQLLDWQQEDYLGFGCAAHSHRAGRSGWSPRPSAARTASRRNETVVST